MAKLRDHRIRRLWSQDELARRAGIAVRTIVNIETRQRMPRLLTMRRITEALEVDWSEVDEFRVAVEDREEKVAA
jgi:transcriptional regulator with XRE-family HTH domain